MSIKISVVTTVYNGQEYFDKSIPSILNQNYDSFEWIIVDDGSTDATPELLNKIATKDKRLKVLYCDRLGRAKALNHAIENAQGQYIANQDFDDISYPERLQLQLEFLDSHPQVGIVGCNYLVEDEIRNQRYIRMPPNSHKLLMTRMAKCVPFAHTLATFRKEAWQQAGGYSEPNDLVDIRLWIKMAKLGWHLGSIPVTLGEHFIYSKSFWHKNFQYSQRQKHLSKVQWQAIKELELPLWMGIYPLGRYIYCYSPKQIKSFLRRTVAGSKEQVM
ncbi:MAG: glycosyltransferase family 2 protein [Calothrix sp. C42_A2020_038]|nr:glycosyltransferase family 2 protein [Calothrix sp. C42_A2020_038]